MKGRQGRPEVHTYNRKRRASNCGLKKTRFRPSGSSMLAAFGTLFLGATRRGTTHLRRQMHSRRKAKQRYDAGGGNVVHTWLTWSKKSKKTPPAPHRVARAPTYLGGVERARHGASYEPKKRANRPWVVEMMAVVLVRRTSCGSALRSPSHSAFGRAKTAKECAQPFKTVGTKLSQKDSHTRPECHVEVIEVEKEGGK